MRNGKNGFPIHPTRKNDIFVDIIEFFEKTTSSISELLAPFASGNFSITEISEKTGLKRTVIWKTLKTMRKEMAQGQSVSFERWRKGHKRTGARPPYGFCLLMGEIVPEPKEYSMLSVIYRLWNSGNSIMIILAQLKERGSKSRTGKEWSYGVVKSIIKRFKVHAVVQKNGKLVLSEQFLKGITLPVKSSQRKKRSL